MRKFKGDGMKFPVLMATGLAVLVFSGPAMADSVHNLVERSRAAEARGEAQSALMLMQAAIVADPARAATYTALGDLYLRRHAIPEAQKYYDEALNIDPANKAAEASMARLQQVEKTASVQAGLLDKN
jgi:tetratricopeptide (TPR) repeat protein